MTNPHDECGRLIRQSKEYECEQLIRQSEEGCRVTMLTFKLIERVGKHAPPWYSYKLACPKRPGGRTTKKSWWLGWNGERLARNRDAGLLAKHFPDIYEQVQAILRRRHHG